MNFNALYKGIFMFRNKAFKLLAIVLSLAILFTNVTIMASAQEAYTVDYSTTGVVENPLYEHLNTNVTTYSSIPKRYYSPQQDMDFDIGLCTNDLNEVISHIRENMVNRVTTIDIYYQDDKKYPNPNDLETLIDNWLELVFAETNNANEGDYLRYVYGGYSSSILTKTIKGQRNNYHYIKINVRYYTTKAEENIFDAKIDKVIEDFGFSSSTTAKQKADVIYNYITKNVSYDYEHLEDDDYKHQFTAYAALINGTAVCQGYATLFYRLARECGLKTRVITGTSRDQNHAWNIVKIGPYYYYLDSTWDAGVEELSYEYYLKGSNSFSEGHTPDEEYTTLEFKQEYPISVRDMELVDTGIANDFEYYTYMGKAYITAYSGSNKVVIIPATIGGCPVYSVDNNTFSDNQNIESIIFSQGIEVIENNVLLNCDNIMSVIIPSSVTEIGEMFVCGNNGYTIYGVEEGFAQEYAANNQIKFKETDKFVCIDGHNVENQFITEYTYHNVCVVCGDSAKTHTLNAIEPLANAAKVEYEYYLYTGKQVKPKIAVFKDANGHKMLEGVDYKILGYYNNINAGFGYIEVQGIGDYAGKGQIPFEIKPINVTQKKIGIEYLSTNYDGGKKCPYVKIEGLKEFEDFKVEYSNNIYPGTAKAKVTAWGNYAGTFTIEFEIKLPATKKITTALYGHNDVKLSWNKVSGAAGYYIYYKKASDKAYSYKGSTTALSYNLANLSSGTKYDFKVVAYYLVGKTKKASSSYTTISATTLKDLKAPSKVTLSLYGYDDVKVSWSKVSYAKGYYVYYKKSSAKSYTYLGKTASTSFKKANLSGGVKYTFKVVPYGVSGSKILLDDSYKTASVYTLKKVATPKITKSSSKKVKVSWTNINGENGYQISQSTSKSKTKIVSTYTTTSGKSKTITAKKGKTYYYKVRAFVKVGKKVYYGPWSTVKSYKLK